jgi:hypothetical protein
MKIRILNLKEKDNKIFPLVSLRELVKEKPYTVIALIFLIIMAITPYTSDIIALTNVTNQTVIARVNVTNAGPDLYKVEITSPPLPIDLTAGGVTNVICNGSARDINGFDDIINVNATFYHSTVASDAADDGNTHYSNSSCLVGGQTCTAIAGSNNLNGSCICQFAVQYYANNGNWQCNMTVADDGGGGDIKGVSTENSSFVTINEVLGIDIESFTIDFGNLSVTQTSDPIRENVSNGGNIDINVTVRGYGGDNESIGQNLSMICDPNAGALANITFDNMRFDTINSTSYANMTNITNQTRQILNLTIPQRTVDTGYGNSSNSTFWRLQIPVGAAGICNGTIIFGAIDATPS